MLSIRRTLSWIHVPVANVGRLQHAFVPSYGKSCIQKVLPFVNSPSVRGIQSSDANLSKIEAQKLSSTMSGMAIVDGNEAAVYVAYALSDNAFIYPITPSSTMGELADEWMSQGRKNSFGQVVKVIEMQSEAGAAGAVHGSAAAGALTSTYTASQGLLLMIPNMYKIAGEEIPCVFHVAARALAGQALSIFGDHSDVMAVRQTGWALLSSHSVQESHDMAVIAHIASLKSSIPFLHFFDGFRLSHEIAKIRKLGYDDLREMLPMDKLAEYRSKALNPNHPHMRGTSQGPDVFFQMLELANSNYANLPGVVEQVMQDFEKKTGRPYKLFDYYGAKDAENVIVMMGGGSQTVEEVIAGSPGEKIGLLKRRLYRPWSSKHFFDSLPSTVNRIAVLDRTKEAGSLGEPLFLDVTTCIQQNPTYKHVTVIGGRYGLGSKDFTPPMAKAVFDNLASHTPINSFTVGIHDDVTFKSLKIPENYTLNDNGTVQCLFYGFGSDGTVGANKDAIKMIGKNTEKFVQGYFAFDAKKSGGVTTSHLRFGPNPIKSNYLVTTADFVGCHNAGYVFKYDMLKYIKPGGTFLLNSPWTTSELMEKNLPGSLKRAIASKNIKFYNIDAHGLALKLGLGKRINMFCQAAFFKLSGVLPFEQSVQLLKEFITKTYSKKGQSVVEKNHAAVDQAIGALTAIEYNAAKWAVATLESRITANDPYVSQLMEPMLRLEGDNIPVSAMKIQQGGRIPMGTAAYEKRGIADFVPTWNASNCTQCNICSIVCPHAAIRPFLLSDEEVAASPHPLTTLKAKGNPDMSSHRYRVQVSPMDCTGCEVCVLSCPDDALSLTPLDTVKEVEADQFDYCIKQPTKEHLIKEATTFKDTQFSQPLLEFSGACAGCGETPYVKLLTQLFGSRLMIANATGCSSIWAGSAPANAYTKNKEGKGPAWGNSLFEDAAEYGFGMAMATAQRREKLRADVKMLLDQSPVALSAPLRSLLARWEQSWDTTKSCDLAKEIVPLLEMEKDNHPLFRQVALSSDLFAKPSQWIIGGDGWAYDIGYGGLDHVLASGIDINILVLDTEMYSNTGGQASKSTQTGALAKFAQSGKQRAKKDLGSIAMAYEEVFVSSISLAANFQQSLNAFKAAESYDGVSLIIAYAPCISHGLSGGMSQMANTQKMAVDSGYWTLYTRDPRKRAKGINPFTLESRKIKTDLRKFLKREDRFLQLHMKSQHMAVSLEDRLAHSLKERHELFTRKSMDDEGIFEQLKEKYGEANDKDRYFILYGSETGNAESLAKYLFYEAKRRDVNAKVMAMEEADVHKIGKAKGVIYVCSTCGQGEFPDNTKMWVAKLNEEVDMGKNDTFKGIKYAVFGLGDSSYCYYQAAARHFDEKMKALGAQEIIPMGEGDDQALDKYETAWDEWMPDLFTEMGAVLKNKDEILPAVNLVRVEPVRPGENPKNPPPYRPQATVAIPLGEGRYESIPERDIWHYVLDLSSPFLASENEKVQYGLGSCLAIHPKNRKEDVDKFLEFYRLQGEEEVTIKAATSDSKRTALPEHTSTRQLFTEVLDLFGKPNKRFYEYLRLFASGSEREHLEHFNHKDGKVDYRLNSEETVTFFDLLKQYPSAHPPLEYLVEMVPTIKPRYYSIASANKMFADQLHLSVMTVDWTTPSGRTRHGLTTNYLKYLVLDNEVNPLINCSVKPAVMNFPTDDMTPQVMVGLGTGIAPFRSLIQYRVKLRQEGKSTGPMSFFMGIRSKKQDYLYGSEFESYVAQQVLSDFQPAFSRDQAHKVYVQDKLAQNDHLYDLLVNQKGYFYLCGPSRRVPEQVREGVMNSWKRTHQLTSEQCQEEYMKMKLAGRWNEETWS